MRKLGNRPFFTYFLLSFAIAKICGSRCVCVCVYRLGLDIYPLVGSYISLNGLEDNRNLLASAGIKGG